MSDEIHEMMQDNDGDVVSRWAWSRENPCWGYTDAAPRPESAGLRRGRAVVVCTYERPGTLLRFLRSIDGQLRHEDEILIVDASGGADTEAALRPLEVGSFASSLRYFRVRGRYKGLTRQRNFALARVQCDLVAFFDDDIVLLPGCLIEMERVHRECGDAVVGVAAFIENSRPTPSLWRFRRLFGVVPHLRPGTYARSGFSIPWEFLDLPADCVDGEWLPGGASMWKTRVAREVGFYEGFADYAKGEDLDFSLRVKTRGRLVMACRARLLHLHEAAGRPDHQRIGYMTIHNLYLIHRRGIPDRTALDTLWFMYAWTVDTLYLAANILFPRRWAATAGNLVGRGKAALDLMRGR